MARPQRGRVCGAAGCQAAAVVLARGVPLCLAHCRRVERHLRALGTTLQKFTGNVLDLLNLDRAQTLNGGALIDESKLVRRKAREVRRAVIARRITSVESQLNFARAQFDVLSNAAPAHKVSDLAGRLWRLQRQIDELDAKLTRLRHATPDRRP